jgi:oligoendopeptidase F
MSYELTHWKLDELLPAPDPEGIEKAIKTFDAKIKKVESWRKKLRPVISVKSFLALLDDYEAAGMAGTKLYSYVMLKFYADTQDQEAVALVGRVQQLYAESENRTLFFSLWWKGLDNSNARRLMKAAGDRRYWLEKMRQFKPHTLSEPEEKVINIKTVNGFNALDNLHEAITNRFTFSLEVDGEKKTFTRDELVMYVRDPNPHLRAAAYQELYRVYGEQAPILAQIYASMVRDWRSENVDLRKFKSPMAVRNLGNDIPDPVVDTMLEVIRKNAGVFQRYFKLKAKWLGLASGKLRRYDIYAPLAASEKLVAYEEAVQMVLETFSEFSPQVGALAKKVFDEGHVDAGPRPGKRGGAFCWGYPVGFTPWVLLNYTGRVRDVATIAHELGHALHAMLAGHHSLLTFSSTLPMAETASVFSEALLTEKLLAKETDVAARRDLLAGVIDDAYATVGRQGYFALWEKEAHEMVAQSKTTGEMAARYLETLHDQFGDAVEISEDFKWEWVSVPHFYGTPFYVYAYSFGQLLVLALYQMYKREGESFKPKYLKILAYGGAESPIRILKEAGIEVSSAAFWQGGYDAISAMIDELERLDRAE